MWLPPEKFVTEDDLILEAARQNGLIRIARIPDPRLPHEIKSRLLHHRRFLVLRIGAEEYRRSEHRRNAVTRRRY